jgi:hypothetical protein
MSLVRRVGLKDGQLLSSNAASDLESGSTEF